MAGYGDDSGLDTWLASYGYTLPAGAPSNAVLRQRASDYLDGLYAYSTSQNEGYVWIGQVADPVNQERQWPRTGAYAAGGVAVADDAIPAAVVNASYYAAYLEASKPGSLSVTTSAATRAVRKKVDVIEVQYHDAKDRSDTGLESAPLNTIIFGMVKPFLIKVSAQPMALLSIGRDSCV